MKIKIWLLAAVLGLGLFRLWAAEPKATNLGYGIFTKSKGKPSPSLRESAEKPRGRRLPTDTFILTTITNQISCEQGVIFGVRFSLTNLAMADGEIIDLDCAAHHPPLMHPSGKVTEVQSGPLSGPVKNGEALVNFHFEISHEYEVLPGYWEMNFSLHGQHLLRQSFQLVKPEGTSTNVPTEKKAE